MKKEKGINVTLVVIWLTIILYCFQYMQIMLATNWFVLYVKIQFPVPSYEDQDVMRDRLLKCSWYKLLVIWYNVNV